MKRSTVLAAIFGVAAAASSLGVCAATFTVDSTLDVQDQTAGDGVCATSTGTCTLRAAITEANALAGADIINLPAGIYTITLAGTADNTNVAGDFDLLSEITINGAGAATTIVQGAASRGAAVERVFHLRAVSVPTVINDLTVRWGGYTTAAGTFGAGVRVDVGAVIATLNRVVIEANDNGTSGGGLAVSGAVNSVTTLNDCTIQNNTAGGVTAGSSIGAGIMQNASTATLNINNSTITGNVTSNTSTTVSASAGGISSIGILNLTDSVVSNNTTTSSGSNTFSGGVHVTAGTATILRSVIDGNRSTVTGGAGSAFAAGIYNQQATVTLTDSSVSNNSASNTATPTSAFHGGIRSLASTTAIAATTITNSTVNGNSSGGEGGGVVNIAGGAFNATTTIIGSTVSNNSVASATGLGGGIENFTTSTGLGVVNVSNSTISGNSAASAAGTYNSGAAASINFDYATIASNTATGNGGGIFQDAAGATNLRNSVVADNAATTGPDIFGAITSQDFNHFENTAGGTFAALANDVAGSDPQLGALANNGGTTLTHRPAIASPVVNTIPNGTSGCGVAVTTSQNGAVRPQQAACEKGSVEIVTFTIGGNVTNLSGTGLILRNNGGNDLPIAGTGSVPFVFTTPLFTGATYAVTVATQPSGPAQVCTVTNGSGTVGTANVSNVTVNCVNGNTAPTINAVANTRRAGNAVSNSTIANVSDVEDAATALTVTVNGGASATVNGVTVNTISTSAAGVVTANVIASCTAMTSNFTLRVTDSGSLFNESTLTVTVDPNLPPTLSYPASSSAAFGQSISVNPATGPSDTGTVSTIVVQSAGTYTGGASVNAAGVVSLTNAAPVGTHTLVIRATDNCAAATNANLSLTVAPAGSTTVITADTPDPSIAGAAVTVAYTVAAMAPGAGTPAGNVTVTDGVDSCVGTVAAGQCSITLNTVGNRNLVATYAGNASFAGSMSANEPHTVTAAPVGTLGITPGSVTFAAQSLGTTSAGSTVTLTNTGTSPLNVTALTAATSPFARSGGTCSNTLPFTLAAGASCTLTYTFAPVTVGTASQTLTVTTNAPATSTITLSGNGFVAQPVQSIPSSSLWSLLLLTLVLMLSVQYGLRATITR